MKKIAAGIRVKVLRTRYGVSENYLGKIGKVVECEPNRTHGMICRVQFPGQQWTFVVDDIQPLGSILNL